MKVNLNDVVKVKLTQEGINTLSQRHYELDNYVKQMNGKGLGPFKLKLDNEGYYCTQLHTLCRDFEDYMRIGGSPPIVNNEIIIN